MPDLHHDLDLPWCRELLSQPGLVDVEETAKTFPDGSVSNSMFHKTLYRNDAIKAHLMFRRPCTEPDSVRSTEECLLMAVGRDVDGMSGRAHGGFNSLILDQMLGACAHNSMPNKIPPATATMTVDYKAPISTPCVVLARAWVTEVTGRKVWLRGILQDGDGKVMASGKALFITARPASL
ncbi:hypothetical protein BAUCODRAFT_266306 [Baudoinia panamericana UAMH 10762]|uniref:Thioesterase domain-containing protein n=1 Tax=Baudoinia panamericana (strain UAMH 10762) TaxID=717646 RepID=M2LFU9_BAUPA|nr:uncharacterized protein BAUCODRAFT_266306 [Baudoinia panamericana UAMH 10762]EMC92907.1 hypothetical protein BAUCODRAFT_266306 [Baudoinia panamericana UAMH 10762]